MLMLGVVSVDAVVVAVDGRRGMKVSLLLLFLSLMLFWFSIIRKGARKGPGIWVVVVGGRMVAVVVVVDEQDGNGADEGRDEAIR